MEINSSSVDRLRGTNSNASGDLSAAGETSAVNSRTTAGNNSIKSKKEPTKAKAGGSSRTTRANEAKLTR